AAPGLGSRPRGVARRANPAARYVATLARGIRAREAGSRPTFLTSASLDAPPPWLLEAVRAGVEVWFDASGALTKRLDAIRQAIDVGPSRRRLFMGLPYYERTPS